jgi:hypothetical protein
VCRRAGDIRGRTKGSKLTALSHRGESTLKKEKNICQKKKKDRML